MIDDAAIRAICDALDAALIVIADVEWQGSAWIGNECCPECSCERPRHDRDCALDAVMDQMRRAREAAACRS